jgi:sugar (pentulose or hexulose) kinase
VSAPPFGSLDILGVADGDGPAQLWRAALDTVTEQAGQIHDAMSAVSGPHRTLVVTGGWSHSEGFLAAKRRRFGELVRSDVPEAGARGAALLAMKAAAS